MSDPAAGTGGVVASIAALATTAELHSSSCEHLPAHDVEPGGDGCEGCLRIGGEWFHLRLCLTCGHVGCCDRSPSQHATAHYDSTGHPVIRSFEPGESWTWCYADEIAFGL
jgi:uncharacterized UBP type Zn finger protein